ncbi:MAG: hypothetical protein JXB07_02890 [Anaerolineae bacterium]|nr:hypothetical protein [Anaerolineae bacterium]
MALIEQDVEVAGRDLTQRPRISCCRFAFFDHTHRFTVEYAEIAEKKTENLSGLCNLGGGKA